VTAETNRAPPSHAICRAIQARMLLEFDYGGLHRVVAPYCHGFTAGGVEVLRAIQVRGESRGGGFGFGKLWTVSKISGARVAPQSFVPDDPHYNPHDSAMARIHCRIESEHGSS
jgi:hypothetical protein